VVVFVKAETCWFVLTIRVACGPLLPCSSRKVTALPICRSSKSGSSTLLR
jgi:hypothetical protein